MADETPNQTELEALADRLARRAEEIAHMDGKIAMSLETEEDIERDSYGISFIISRHDIRLEI